MMAALATVSRYRIALKVLIAIFLVSGFGNGFFFIIERIAIPLNEPVFRDPYSFDTNPDPAF